MAQLAEATERCDDFVLMHQLKEGELQMLQFLFHAEFQNALLRF